MTRDAKDTNGPLLSVIVPAYNVEHFIGMSLESVLRQKRANEVELIIVDDGSTDRTLDSILAVKAAEQGHAITVIHQENRGVSAARNAAIAGARSPYIGFLDSDDVWAPNFLDVILPLLEAGEADIIEFNVGIVNSAGDLIDEVELIASDTVGPRAGGTAALMEFARVCQAFPAARVYRRALWNGIEFPAGRVYEDCSAIPLVYTRARTLHRLFDQLYFYRRRAGSITQKATLHTVSSLAMCAQEALDRCDGGANDVYWIAMFRKLFSYTCIQTSRVDASAYADSMKIVDASADRYRAFAAQRNEIPLELRYRWRIFADRRVFQTKRVVKRAFGLDLRPPSAPPRRVHPAGLASRTQSENR